ncbi:MAG: hypothetical protein P4M11_04435 [Candidatus Pacebacteria bacterium]|nr:hypothetical protein [Candidatus Paceibacterota bacterium]
MLVSISAVISHARTSVDLLGLEKEPGTKQPSMTETVVSTASTARTASSRSPVEESKVVFSSASTNVRP